VIEREGLQQKIGGAGLHGLHGRLDGAPFAPSPWTPCSRPIPAIPARRWPGAGGLHAVAALPALRPDDPIWPNRDRFVLSNGHASMLLYSLLHLTGVKAVNPNTKRSASLAVTARRHQALPAARQPCPGHPEYRWTSRRRNHHRPARPGRRQQRRHGHGARWLASTSTGPASRCSTTTSTPLRRRRHDGRRLQRGRLARRPPDARQPLLDLRQQPHHHRGPHRPGLQRGRGHALHRPTAGTSRASATPTTPNARAQAFKTFKTRPTGRR
jgi:hypothetical protein